MKKGIAIVAAALLVVGLAASAFAHGPRWTGANSPRGYGHMMGMGPMMGAHMGSTAEGHPCLTETTPGSLCSQGSEGRTLTPEEQKEFKERSKAYVERYLERFLPEYQVTPKAETPKAE